MRTFRRLLTQAWKALKIPVLLVGLIVALAGTASQIMLRQVAEEQESNLRLLTGAYLDGLSAAVLPPSSAETGGE